ncbi:MAG: flagellar hook-length control protein FliK [Rhodoferax sp.]|uniref:flagellar hook-length control protein FliK n=1 Tax=Rhodoferax sp. TaxID=50421 RepID=UPI002731CE4B|nr:flagellar hook-length control protein FliK [Rhodoferax sp.]MDP1530410.1 flagellar hook-length control protein FliK [Rhodoferax sp.]MDP1943244.1 flagellar hook-length control protein FliK [Rhodoferax sp.]
MSGLTPLVDTLLATRLAQRIDLLPLKSELEIAGPGSASPIGKVANDTRLPSRAGMQQQLGVGLLKSGAGESGQGQGRGSPGAGESVTLSVAARVVSAILQSDAGAASRITGSQAIWPQGPSALAPVLAASLADTVAQSGLFYESHLLEHVAGTRPLAQLLQEPQARLGAAPPAAQAEAPPAPERPLPAAGTRAAVPVFDAALPDAGAREAAAGPTDNWRPASPVGTTPAPVAEAIHPEALPLVRQQLELLTLPLFRWSGEAWPGAPMDWEIQEEQGERQAADEPQARTWSTRLALRLPALGAVELRLTLAGSALQVQLGAGEPATVTLLSGAGAALPPRFAALGLQLTDLKIGALAREPQAAP